MGDEIASVYERDLPYKLGAKPDRHDPRDFKYRTLITNKRAQQAQVLDRKFYTMVDPSFRINQGSEGTCVGHANTNVLLAGPTEHDTYSEFNTEEGAHQFARRLYLEASGDLSYQQGMWPRDACAKLLEWGLIASYWKVEQVDDIISALLTFGPVTIAIPWYYSMYYENARLGKAFGGKWIKVNLDSEHVGYHDIALTGIDLDPDNGAPPWVRVDNSWGHGWLDNGTGRLSIEYLRRLNLLDNWTFAEEPF